MRESFRDRIFGPEPTPTPTPEPTRPTAPAPGDDYEEDTDAGQCFARLRGIQARAHKAEFRFADGHAERLDYAWCPRITWTPGEHAERIELHFPALGIKVVCQGINLWHLKEYFGQHRVTWVEEAGDDPRTLRELALRAQEQGEAPVIITRIALEDRAAALAGPDE